MADDPIIQLKPQLAGMSGVDDLKAIEALTGTGIAARTGTNTWALRTLTAPAAGITVSNGDGASGNPTLALANDLAAYEGLSSTGMVARTGDGTAAARTLTAPAAGITVTNGNGVSGNPTLALADDAVMIGDTQYDIQMAVNAGVRGIGVDWGYHTSGELIAAGAAAVATSPAHLKDLLA